MHEVYEKTALTPLRAARSSGYIDWASQPSLFKHYPDFLFRYPFGAKEELDLIELARAITSTKEIGGKPYHQLNTPSAGNLHPVELYVQIRGVKGVLSGIYHVDASREELVLIREIELDGLEPSLGLHQRIDGLVFIVSCVPYRSEWKYGDRALRYVYLDVGHQVGALVCAATLDGQDATILSDFDVKGLNRVMGFKEEEFACAVVAIGTRKAKEVQEIVAPLMQVQPTPYCQSNGYVPGVIEDKAVFDASVLKVQFDLSREVIANRRSARFFSGERMQDPTSEYFMHLFSQIEPPVHCYAVVLQEGRFAPGVYLNEKMVKEGSFAHEMSALLVDQRFIKEANMILVMTSNVFDANSLMSAGAFAHLLHLDAQSKGVGFTGIGAFYDKKLQAFLGVNEYILYVCAMGKEKK